MSAPTLPEIAERDATGRVAELYEVIRRAVGLPLVNLVYRVLAASDTLELAWAQLGPNLRDPGIPDMTRALVGEITVSVPPVPRAALATVGASETQLAMGGSTVAAYMHANPRNILVVTALLDSAPGMGQPPPTSSEAAPAPAWDILPMASLDGLDASARMLIDEMSAPLVTPGEEALVPSVLRHFANSPTLLAVLWTALAPAVTSGAVARDAETVTTTARDLARRLPYPVEPIADAATRETLQRFQFTLSRMIVVGRLLEQALTPAESVSKESR
jgi:hypothetical protein